MKQKELARALGLSESAVTRLRQRGMPVHSLEAAQAWRAANVAAYVRSEAPTTGPAAPLATHAAARLDLGQERAALAREQRTRVALQNAVQRGQYAPIELLAQVLANASQAVAERFDHLPGEVRRACPDLPVAAAEKVMAVIAAARNAWVTETAELMASRVAELEVPDPLDDDEDEAAPVQAASAAELREQLLTARLERERAEAQLATLRTAEAAGDLIRTDAIRAAHGRRLSALREALLQIPARLAPVLAAESDQARCHDTMQRELYAVLRQVSGQVDT